MKQQGLIRFLDAYTGLATQLVKFSRRSHNSFSPLSKPLAILQIGVETTALGPLKHSLLEATLQ
jgi:hypothetical protein